MYYCFKLHGSQLHIFGNQGNFYLITNLDNDDIQFFKSLSTNLSDKNFRIGKNGDVWKYSNGELEYLVNTPKGNIAFYSDNYDFIKDLCDRILREN